MYHRLEDLNTRFIHKFTPGKLDSYLSSGKPFKKNFKLLQ